MAIALVMVAGAGWDPSGSIRKSLPSFDIEVVPFAAISSLVSVDRDLPPGLVFVDRPSIGYVTADVVTELQQQTDSSIIVLDEDPDLAEIVRVVMAGADIYAPRSAMTELVRRWAPGTGIGLKNAAEKIVRNRANDAVKAATLFPRLRRTDVLGDQLLKSVTGEADPRKPLLRRARPALERSLLAEFGDLGVGDALPLEDSGTGHAPPPELFWNTFFPENKGILLNEPHLVVGRAEYRLETSLGPEPEPGAATNPQESGKLLGKEVIFRLEAENGEFRPEDSDAWATRISSSPTVCTDEGTEPFRVVYRAVNEGEAVIDALLIVDNGSIDQQCIELTVVSGGGKIVATPRADASLPPGRPVGGSLSNAPGAAYRLHIRRDFADLEHVDIEYASALVQRIDGIPPKLRLRLGELARNQYDQLGLISADWPLPRNDPQHPLRLDNPGESALRLAKIGAQLHESLFVKPVGVVDSRTRRDLKKMGKYLAGVGDEASPPLLQILAEGYPLPWGLLYDRSRRGGEDLKTPADVKPEGFWGRRFDIYRTVQSVNRPAQRGERRWLKPVIGAFVPRGAEQELFVSELRSGITGDKQLAVQETSSTIRELQAWAESGTDSDMIYAFCHAVPTRLNALKSVPEVSSLGFGDEETAELVATLDQLRHWWKGPRPTNPVVFLNACSSGQQDIIYGAPFVEFFVGEWQAQAFIGTDWPVNSSFADVFGKLVLQEILQRRASLREAFRKVADVAAADLNFFPLMYAIYGLNTVRFTDSGTG
jgi:hypothetical protein